MLSLWTSVWDNKRNTLYVAVGLSGESSLQNPLWGSLSLSHWPTSIQSTCKTHGIIFKRFFKISFHRLCLYYPSSGHQNILPGYHRGPLAGRFHFRFTEVYPGVTSDLFQIIITSWHFSQKSPKAAHYILHQICMNLASVNISVFRSLSSLSVLLWPCWTSSLVCECGQDHRSPQSKPPDMGAALAVLHSRQLCMICYNHQLVRKSQRSGFLT